LPSRTLRPGDVVAKRFQIRRRSGSGGAAFVYQAHDGETNRAVAVKVLSRARATSALDAEGQVLSTLDHPHVVGYVAHGAMEDGAPFVVMPWLEGQDLQERLTLGRLSVEEAMTLASRVADALAYLHARDIVHGDLKPSNLFLVRGEVSQVVLIDLGHADASRGHESLRDSFVPGTPGFMAPEQVHGRGPLHPTVDVFALGSVLFECLTGEPLFCGSHPLAVLAKSILEPPPLVRQLRADVPEALERLIERMVSKDVRYRPQHGEELCRWLLDPPSVSLAPRSLPPSSLTANEQRVVTVLAVVLPSSHPPRGQTETSSLFDTEPFHPARFGVHVHHVSGRTAVVFGPDGLTASDQACVLARFGASLKGRLSGASVALAAGSAVTGPRPPVGVAIDRVMDIVQQAPLGTGVWLDERTAALIESRFNIRRDDSGFLLEEERASLDPTRPLLGRATPCVGRDQELAMLETAFLECAAGGGPKVMVVTAAAGAGKSRLRHEFLRRLQTTPHAHVLLQCRGDPLHLATPYAQSAQAVRAGLDLHHRKSPGLLRRELCEQVARLLPETEARRVAVFLGELIGESFEDAEDLSLRAARGSVVAMDDQIHRAFEDVVRAWCRDRPLILVFEDAQWCDAASIKLLDVTLQRLASAKLLVLVLARPEVEERFPALWSSHRPTFVRLPPLPRAACLRLLHEVMGDATGPEQAERIVDQSLGNAFYLEELIRAPELPSLDPRPRGLTSVRSELPETIIAAAQARLERLAPEARKVLRAASVFGVVFPLDGVSALVGEDLATSEHIRHMLIEEEAIAEPEPHRSGVRELVFRHAFLRGASYASLTDEDRALGHRLAAMWLSGAGEDHEVVALHWLEAGEPKNAAVSFETAGQAFRSRAQADAAARCVLRSILLADVMVEGVETVATRVRQFADALEVTRRIDTRDVVEGLERHLPWIDGALPSSPAAIVNLALERTLDALRRTSDECVPVVLACAGSALGAIADFEGAKRLLLEAATRAGANGVIAQQVRYASAKVAFWMGEYGAVIAHLSNTLLPSDSKERLEMLLILATAVVSHDGKDALARGLDYVSRAEALVEASGRDPSAEVRCSKARMLCFFFAGQHALAAEAAEAAVSLSKRAGLRYEECINTHNVGELCIRLGELSRARPALAASSAIAKKIGADAMDLHNEALLAYIDGRAARIGEIAERFRSTTDPWREMHMRYWLGHLLASKGSPDASRELTQVVRLARELKVRAMGDECSAILASLPSQGDAAED
jgi:eukaryotic-like serine/threonine-protein kinase